MFIRVLLVLALAVWGSSPPAAAAEEGVAGASRAPFSGGAGAREHAVAEQKMALVCHANAQRGAAGRGVTIPGNQVMMVFRNHFAVRLLPAAPRAGFEAPIRIYLYENPDGTATVTYRTPSAVLAPYPHPAVRAVAAELDPIFKAIVDRAVAAPRVVR